MERLTFSSLITFLETYYYKYTRSIIELGTAADALDAQGVGEPEKQMKWNSFEF